MKAITATPATIGEIFQKEYIIPNFQRPYSWEADVECSKLWEDITDFSEKNPSPTEKYFLGNIVVNPSVESGVSGLQVVDGQQRLITLTLLIKALFSYASTFKRLESCLKIKNPLTDKVIDELRLKTHVISQDMKALEAVVFDKNFSDSKSSFHKNYNFFRRCIEEWKQVRNRDAFEKLIVDLLDKVVLLPINCDTTDDALTIFETINNRGKPLQDSDVFKARLYGKLSPDKRDQFIVDWNELEEHDKLFRIYMHILRAKDGISENEKGLRPYFDEIIAKMDVEEVIRSLKKIDKIASEWIDDDEIFCLRMILQIHPNSYYIYPLYVFLYKYTTVNPQTDEIEVAARKLEEFKKLLKLTIKFVFVKSIIGRSSDIKSVAFRAYVKISKSTDYTNEYKLTDEEYSRFSSFLAESSQIGKPYKTGIIYLSAYLNSKQDVQSFAKLLNGKVEIEHILPRRWNNYDGWTEKTHAEDIDIIGNLMPLSKKANSSASNGFFDYKKKVYAKSNVRDAQDLAQLIAWTRESLGERNKEKIAVLKEFFGAGDSKTV